jgi:predicted molibdopterin-dependent oxidoreductase YjgC
MAGSYRSVWASTEVAASPALAFLHPSQRVEVSPVDALRLGLSDGAEMLVADETGAGVRARVALRDAVPAGTVFLQRSIPSQSANLLRGATVEIVAIPEPVEPLPPEEEAPVAEALV